MHECFNAVKTIMGVEFLSKFNIRELISCFGKVFFISCVFFLSQNQLYPDYVEKGAQFMQLIGYEILV